MIGDSPTCPKCKSAAITYSKAKLFDGKTTKCSTCGHTFDQDHAYAQPKIIQPLIAEGGQPGDSDPTLPIA